MDSEKIKQNSQRKQRQQQFDYFSVSLYQIQNWDKVFDHISKVILTRDSIKGIIFTEETLL